MTLDRVLAQPRAMEALLAALKSEKLHHAYLFAGPEGVGKQLAAIGFAQALICKRSPNQGCGQCSDCSRVERRIHPDVTWVMPDSEQVDRGIAGSADFAGTPSREIRVEQIRSLQERLSFRPLEARWKVVIIASAHQMNEQAQNAFLKTLEEPPVGTVIILLASAADRLLPTLRSRCTQIPFGALPRNLIVERLRRERKLEEPTALLAAFLSGGSLGRALQLDVEQLSRRKQRIEQFEAAGVDVQHLLAFAESAGSTRAEAEGTLQILRLWIRDLLVAKSKAGQLLNGDLEELAHQSAARRSELVLHRFHELIETAYQSICLRNGLPRLQLERMLIEMGLSGR